MSVSEVDFIGRWISKASVDDLNTKLDEYSRIEQVNGRDAHLIFNIKERLRREIAKRDAPCVAD